MECRGIDCAIQSFIKFAIIGVLIISVIIALFVVISKSKKQKNSGSKNHVKSSNVPINIASNLLIYSLISIFSILSLISIILTFGAIKRGEIDPPLFIFTLAFVIVLVLLIALNHIKNKK